MKELDKIMELLEVKNDVALAKALGLKSSGAISNWRKRGFVPVPTLREWEIQFDKPRGWFSDSIETEKADYPMLVQGIIGKVVKLNELDQIEAFRLLAERFPDEQMKEK